MVWGGQCRFTLDSGRDRQTNKHSSDPGLLAALLCARAVAELRNKTISEAVVLRKRCGAGVCGVWADTSKDVIARKPGLVCLKQGILWVRAN